MWHLQDEAFFAHLKEAIRLEKFSSRSRVERVAELEALLAVVEVRLKSQASASLTPAFDPSPQSKPSRMGSGSWTRTPRC